MHEGTVKIYVNYIPVADCSQMNPEMFKIIQKRAKSVNGILYCDADLLRMFMYLELSRPRGEVARWGKVFDRLTLLNHEYPVLRVNELNSCDEDLMPHSVSSEIRAEILDLCVKRKCVMMGPEFVKLLQMNKDKISLEGLSRIGGPVIFMSTTPHVDAEDIKYMMSSSHSHSPSPSSLGGRGIILKEFPAPSDHIYDYVTVSQGGNLIAMILKEDSCNAYTTLKVDGADMRVGTPDLLLHFYYTVLIFGSKKKKSYFHTPIDCIVHKLYMISERARSHPTQFVPAFGLRCSGHQKGIATLLKLKSERTKKKTSHKRRVTRKR
jgi:hypothetical protein